MPNLIDKLISRVDAIRQKAADKFGLPAHDMYRVLRTYASGEIGSGSFTDLETEITPTPRIKFTGGLRLDVNGLVDDRKMKASEISLTFTENFLQGDPKTAGQECFYKLVERNSQGADTTYWQLVDIPECNRDEINWLLEFKHYTVCS